MKKKRDESKSSPCKLVFTSRVVCGAQVAPGEGALLEVAQWGRLLLYSTQRGGVHALVSQEPDGVTGLKASRPKPYECAARLVLGSSTRTASRRISDEYIGAIFCEVPRPLVDYAGDSRLAGGF